MKIKMGRLSRKWEDNITQNGTKKNGCEGVDWFKLLMIWSSVGPLVSTGDEIWVPWKAGKFFDQLNFSLPSLPDLSPVFCNYVRPSFPPNSPWQFHKEKRNCWRKNTVIEDLLELRHEQDKLFCKLRTWNSKPRSVPPEALHVCGMPEPTYVPEKADADRSYYPSF
jgi:hypothetical protein